MLKINDETFRALTSPGLPATVRLGTSSTYIPCYLANSLDLFRAAYPNALVEVTEGYRALYCSFAHAAAMPMTLSQPGNKTPRSCEAGQLNWFWQGPDEA